MTLAEQICQSHCKHEKGSLLPAGNEGIGSKKGEIVDETDKGHGSGTEVEDREERREGRGGAQRRIDEQMEGRVERVGWLDPTKG